MCKQMVKLGSLYLEGVQLIVAAKSTQKEPRIAKGKFPGPLLGSKQCLFGYEATGALGCQAEGTRHNPFQQQGYTWQKRNQVFKKFSTSWNASFRLPTSESAAASCSAGGNNERAAHLGGSHTQLYKEAPALQEHACFGDGSVAMTFVALLLACCLSSTGSLEECVLCICLFVCLFSSVHSNVFGIHWKIRKFLSEKPLV